MRYNTYYSWMNWEILFHPDVEIWISRLNQKEYEAVIASLDALEEVGPALGRPFVDHIKNSLFTNMKELRPPGTKLRILFAFDFKRRAVLLVGGNKNKNWSKWYEKNIPMADKRFEKHIKSKGENNA